MPWALSYYRVFMSIWEYEHSFTESSMQSEIFSSPAHSSNSNLQPTLRAGRTQEITTRLQKTKLTLQSIEAFIFINNPTTFSNLQTPTGFKLPETSTFKHAEAQWKRNEMGFRGLLNRSKHFVEFSTDLFQVPKKRLAK
jgi:hypothetical protein